MHAGKRGRSREPPVASDAARVIGERKKSQPCAAPQDSLIFCYPALNALSAGLCLSTYSLRSCPNICSDVLQRQTTLRRIELTHR